DTWHGSFGEVPHFLLIMTWSLNFTIIANNIKEIMEVMTYFSPELVNDGTYSKIANIYSFGVMM
ncbi:38125_t:CDS:1, partial [Gigaspora margarita]